MLPGEDLDMFRMTRESFLRALKPQDAVQLVMVDGAVSARWRLNRCQHAEADVITQRTARARKLIAQRFEALSRTMRCENFSAAALAAQCRESEAFRRHYQEWKDLRACERRRCTSGTRSRRWCSRRRTSRWSASAATSTAWSSRSIAACATCTC